MKRKEVANKIRGNRNPAKRPEVREKISQNNGMKKRSVRWSRMDAGNGNNTEIFAYTPDGKKHYHSMSQCARDARRFYGVVLDIRLISRVCKGGALHHKNWRFEYA